MFRVAPETNPGPAAHGEAQEVVGPLCQAGGEAAQLWVFHLRNPWLSKGQAHGKWRILRGTPHFCLVQWFISPRVGLYI